MLTLFRPNFDAHDLFSKGCRYSVLLVALVFSSNAVLADTFNVCGNIENAYGPYDYINPDHFQNKLPIVEGAHFTPEVEALISGRTSATPLPDLDYTLRAFPNHHRALYAVMRLQLRSGNAVLGRIDTRVLSAECYFDRAIRFQPADGWVRMIYGIYLHKKGMLNEALSRYHEALELIPNEMELHYNLGLLYCDLKNYSDAVKYAKKAYSAGYPLPGLRNRLIKAGYWDKDSIQSTEDEPK